MRQCISATATRILNFFQTSKTTLYWSSLIALVLALLSFPVWQQIFTLYNVPVEIKMAAPGAEYVRLYWDDPTKQQNAYERIPVIPIESQTWQVKVEALGEKNRQAKFTQVWILDISTPQDRIDWSEIVTEGGNWQLEDYPNAPQGKAAVANTNRYQSLSVQLEGRERKDLTVKLLRHAWSGKARVTVNHKVHELDLFSPSGDVEVLTFPSVGTGDGVARDYQITVVDTPWRKLKFVAEGGSEVKVEEVKVRGQEIASQGNGEYILPFKFWNRLNCAVFSTVISWFWMTMLFVSTVHLWQGQTDKRFGNLSYMIGLSATLGGFWMLVFYPAVLTPDSINQWSQALSNQYHTWYPPITAMLMHITQFFTKSPSLFCFIQGTLFWFSILYLLRQVTRRDRFFLGNVCFIVGLPTLWLYSVALVNNVWASTFSLLASTLLIRAIDAKSNSLFFTSVALLSVAICFRHEAVFLSIVPMSLGLFYLWIKSKIYKKIIVIILISLIVIAPAKLLEKLPNVGYRTPTSLVFIGQYVGTIFHGKQQISENEIDVEKNSIDRQFGSGTFDKLLEKYDCTSPNYIFLPPEDSIISASLIQDKTFWVINKTLSIAFRHPLAFIKHKACNVSYLFQIPQISYIYDVRTDQSVYIESDLNKVGIKTDYRLPHVKIWVDNILIVTHQNSIYSLMYRHYVFILFSLIFLFLGLCLKNNEFLIPSLVSCVYLIALLIPDSSTAWRYLLPNYVLSWVCLLGAISNLLAWLFPLLPSKHKVNLS